MIKKSLIYPQDKHQTVNNHTMRTYLNSFSDLNENNRGRTHNINLVDLESRTRSISMDAEEKEVIHVLTDLKVKRNNEIQKLYRGQI